MLFRTFLASLLFWCCFAVQASDIASLSVKLESSTGAARVDIFNELAKANWGVSPDEIHKFAGEAYELAQRIDYPAGEAAALRNMGIGYWYQENLDLALEKTLAALQIYEGIGDEQAIAASLSTVGTVYLNLSRFERAMETYQRALVLAERTGDQNRVGILLSNLGTTALGMEKPEFALGYFERALALLQENGSQLDVLTALGNIASAQRRMKHFDEALAVNARIIDIATKIDSRIRLGDAYSDTGQILISLGRFDEAGRFLGLAVGVAQQAGLKRVEREAELQLSSLHEATGDYRKALEHLRKHDALRKEIFNERLAETTAQLQQKYESEKREAEIRSNELQLGVERATRNFLGVLSIFALLLAITLFLLYRSHRRKNVLLREVAATDPLTGLLNRRAMMEAMQREHDSFERGLGVPSIALIDVDHFKQINDQYGHAQGDRVLVRIAGCIHDSVRGIDSVARWGGEEFLVLMPSCKHEDALQSADRIRLRLADLEFPVGRDRCSVTATIGVSQLGLAETIGAFIKRADMALYRGKSAGRNRVESATLPSE